MVEVWRIVLIVAILVCQSAITVFLFMNRNILKKREKQLDRELLQIREKQNTGK